ncbi:hypothetical protein M3Y98_00710000 [Aphelenchoides besseyi]|nr:hypothetical protein M3Y98_00710000 [Aphelenchoides besseyi]KAI6210340.1 hypothetical protein M3Y96_00317900 [Aphelenchoides besseyi]
MLHSLLTILALGIVIKLGIAYGNDKCIKLYKNKQHRGFDLSNCADAKVAIKWQKKHELGLLFKNVENVTIVLNDVCEFDLVGKKYPVWSFLILGTDGKLRNLWQQEVYCYGKNLLNEVDDQWIWSEFRVQTHSYSSSAQIRVFANYPLKGEGEEYVPMNSTSSSSSKSDCLFLLNCL